MSVNKELSAKALGEFALQMITDYFTSDHFVFITDGMAVRALQEIQDAVNEETLTDFECIEEIIAIFDRYGLNNSRHDFG